MSNDRIESRNLAAEKPELVKELSEKYAAWAERANVAPWPVAQNPGKKKRK